MISLARTGESPEEELEIVNAGGMGASILKGGAFIDSATSFIFIRGGHIDITVLGALEVDQEGSLASWIIPGKKVPGMGGAMDLVAGADNIIVTMTHASKSGQSKLLSECTLPLTGKGCIRRVLTDLALMDIEDGKFILRERAPGVSVDEIINLTDGELVVPDHVPEMTF